MNLHEILTDIHALEEELLVFERKWYSFGDLLRRIYERRRAGR